MVIETKEFPHFAHAYKGVYSDCYLVGIAEVFILRPGAAEPIWEQYEDKLPETLNEFRESINRLKADGAKLVTFIMITKSGIVKRDFEVGSILDQQPNQFGALAGVGIPLRVILNHLHTCSLTAPTPEIRDSLLAAHTVLDSLPTTSQDLQIPERVKEFIRAVDRLRAAERSLSITPDNSLNKAKRNELAHNIRIFENEVDSLFGNVSQFMS